MATSFYVTDNDGKPVGAQYLYVNGKPVLDPNTDIVKKIKMALIGFRGGGSGGVAPRPGL